MITFVICFFLNVRLWLPWGWTKGNALIHADTRCGPIRLQMAYKRRVFLCRLAWLPRMVCLEKDVLLCATQETWYHLWWNEGHDFLLPVFLNNLSVLAVWCEFITISVLLFLFFLPQTHTMYTTSMNFICRTRIKTMRKYWYCCFLFYSLLEEVGTTFTFEGTRRYCNLRTVLRIHNPQFYWKVMYSFDIF